MAIQWGYCTASTNGERFKAAGWDYIEESIQGFLQGTLPEGDWTGPQRLKECPLPIIAGNSMVPATHKITGPAVDADALKLYMVAVLLRAKQMGMKTLVFGSAGARNHPEGFDRTKAKDQILAFLQTAAQLAEQAGVTIVCEPLNRKESNIINSVAEGMEYVKELNHPNFQCLVDSYHFWLEKEPLKNLDAAMPWIKHVHLADEHGRVSPGESGQSDYKPFFKVLKTGGYAGGISVETSDGNKIAGKEANILNYVKENWEAA